jgi:hypothetical protein
VKLKPGEQASPDALEDVETIDEDERVIRCASCGARITHERERITMNGAHEHEFMNPSALRFVVQCFASAPGCASEGERSDVWSWFPGFAWQIAICRRCSTHLGWSFHGARTFHALVKERLVS